MGEAQTANAVRSVHTIEVTKILPYFLKLPVNIVGIKQLIFLPVFVLGNINPRSFES